MICPLAAHPSGMPLANCLVSRRERERVSGVKHEWNNWQSQPKCRVATVAWLTIIKVWVLKCKKGF